MAARDNGRANPRASRYAMAPCAPPRARRLEERPPLDAQREPPFRGPWPVWTIAGLILLSYAVQSATMDIETAARVFGMTPAALLTGHWTPLFTDLFIHGGWAHAGMNAVGALAFGAPAARFLGLRARGAVGLFLFYILCGVLSNLGYAMLHLHSMMPLAGASGAVSGLFGAASRLIERPWALAPFRSRTVVGTAVSWIIVNVILGFLHYAPGIGDVQVAWEAHLAGYAAGLFLIGPFAAVFRARPA
jgi:membrane associated rhomboid family serine protease